MISLIANPLPNGHTITDKAAVLAQTDPHGAALTIIAVSTVFLGLIILFFIYTLSGNIFSGKYKKDPAKKKVKQTKVAAAADANSEIAAAIALALNSGCGNEAEVAVATALHLYLSNSTYVNDSFVITINGQDGNWNKKINFRKLPR